MYIKVGVDHSVEATIRYPPWGGVEAVDTSAPLLLKTFEITVLHDVTYPLFYLSHNARKMQMMYLRRREGRLVSDVPCRVVREVE